MWFTTSDVSIHAQLPHCSWACPSIRGSSVWWRKLFVMVPRGHSETERDQDPNIHFQAMSTMAKLPSSRPHVSKFLPPSNSSQLGTKPSTHGCLRDSQDPNDRKAKIEGRKFSFQNCMSGLKFILRCAHLGLKKTHNHNTRTLT